MTADNGINGHLREIAKRARSIDELKNEMARLELCLLTNHGEVTASLLKAVELAKQGMDVITEEIKLMKMTPDTFKVD